MFSSLILSKDWRERNSVFYLYYTFYWQVFQDIKKAEKNKHFRGRE